MKAVGGLRHWLRRDVRRALDRYRLVPIHSIPGLYGRMLRLHGGFCPRRLPAQRPERVVISLSTIPSRIKRLRPVLNGLLDQIEPADRIVLALPEFSFREQRPYPEPNDLGLPPGVDVLRCADLGPGTKLLPVLRQEASALVIAVDDDVVYPRDFIATLLAAHREKPFAAIGYRGVCLRAGIPFPDLRHVFATAIDAPHAVDILFGTWGYLIPPGALPDAVHDLGQAPAGLQAVDDVWVSGHLARAGVPRLVVPARHIPVETPNAMRNSLAGGPNRSGENDQSAISVFEGDW